MTDLIPFNLFGNFKITKDETAIVLVGFADNGETVRWVKSFQAKRPTRIIGAQAVAGSFAGLASQDQVPSWRMTFSGKLPANLDDVVNESGLEILLADGVLYVFKVLGKSVTWETA